MRDNPLPDLGQALRTRRKQRKLTQPMLAARVGRSTPRISDLEKNLLAGHVGKDPLGLLTEVCDALDLVPVLVPRERIQAVRRALGVASTAATPSIAGGRAFDDLFVDLAAQDEGGEEDH